MVPVVESIYHTLWFKVSLIFIMSQDSIFFNIFQISLIHRMKKTAMMKVRFRRYFKLTENSPNRKFYRYCQWNAYKLNVYGVYLENVRYDMRMWVMFQEFDKQIENVRYDLRICDMIQECEIWFENVKYDSKMWGMIRGDHLVALVLYVIPKYCLDKNKIKF